jgi:peptide/nickel transport system substrate-binding protein
MYPASDTVRKDLAQAFASDARAVGVDAELEGLGWEAIEPRMGGDALVLGGAPRSTRTWCPTSPSWIRTPTG